MGWTCSGTHTYDPRIRANACRSKTRLGRKTVKILYSGRQGRLSLLKCVCQSRLQIAVREHFAGLVKVVEQRHAGRNI